MRLYVVLLQMASVEFPSRFIVAEELYEAAAFDGSLWQVLQSAFLLKPGYAALCDIETLRTRTEKIPIEINIEIRLDFFIYITF